MSTWMNNNRKACSYPSTHVQIKIVWRHGQHIHAVQQRSKPSFCGVINQATSTIIHPQLWLCRPLEHAQNVKLAVVVGVKRRDVDGFAKERRLQSVGDSHAFSDVVKHHVWDVGVGEPENVQGCLERNHQELRQAAARDGRRCNNTPRGVVNGVYRHSIAGELEKHE